MHNIVTKLLQPVQLASSVPLSANRDHLGILTYPPSRCHTANPPSKRAHFPRLATFQHGSLRHRRAHRPNVPHPTHHPARPRASDPELHLGCASGCYLSGTGYFHHYHSSTSIFQARTSDKERPSTRWWLGVNACWWDCVCGEIERLSFGEWTDIDSF